MSLRIKKFILKENGLEALNLWRKTTTVYSISKTQHSLKSFCIYTFKKEKKEKKRNTNNNFI